MLFPWFVEANWRIYASINLAIINGLHIYGATALVNQFWWNLNVNTTIPYKMNFKMPASKLRVFYQVLSVLVMLMI